MAKYGQFNASQIDMLQSFSRRKSNELFGQWHPPASPQAQSALQNEKNQTQPLGWRAMLLRVWLVIAALWLTVYVCFRIHYINLTPSLAVFSVLVCLAEMHMIVHLYGMFYGLWPRRYQMW